MPDSKPTYKVLAIASMKGGVGKSKANLGLACQIAASDPTARVLLVDACQDQGYLSAMLAYQKNEAQKGLGAVITALQDRKPHAEVQRHLDDAMTPVCVRLADNRHIDFLPAAAETLGDLTLLGWKETKRGELLYRFISEHANTYTHIIFDTVPLIRIPTTASVFGLADSVALIVDCTEPSTLAGVNGFVLSARKYGANLSGVIVNMFDKKIAMSRSAKEVITTYCYNHGLKIMATIPRSATMVNSTSIYQTKTGTPATGMYVAGEFDRAQRHLFDNLTQHFDQISLGMEA